MKWVWITLGLGAGFVLGSRAGRQQFDRIASWSKRAVDDVGLAAASEHVVDAARSAGKDLKEAAVTRSQSALGDAADAISEHIESVGESVGDAVKSGS